MYIDDYESEVLRLLRRQFHPDNYKRLYPMVARYYNTLKKIVNLKSIIYKREAERAWYSPDGKTADEDYSNLINESNIDTTMQTCNKLTNVNNTSFVRIMSDIPNESMKFAAVPSEQISIEQDPDDPSKIKALLHRVCAQDSYTRMGQLAYRDRKSCPTDKSYVSKYFYWDDEHYIILDGDYNIVPQEGNPENKNPYGIIPYVLYSNMDSIGGSIWNETVNSDLYEGTLQVNVLQTYLNNATKLLGYLQLYIKGLDIESFKKINEKVSDALQPILIENPNAEVDSIEMTNGTQEIRDTIHDVISEISDNHGVTYNSRVQSGAKSSGLALAIEQDQINNIREEQMPLYRKSEKEMALKTVIIANTDLKTNIDIKGSLSINFYEEEPLITEKDKIDRDKFDLKTNLKSVIDLYKERDPDTEDDKQALQRIMENKKINDEFLPTFDMGLDDGSEDAE
jgi:hypothetical protein